MDRIRSIEPFAVTFYENREKPINIRLALAARESAIGCCCKINSNYLSEVRVNLPYAMYYASNCGIRVNGDKFNQYIEEYPEYADLFREVYDYVKDFDTKNTVLSRLGYYENLLRDVNA